MRRALGGHVQERGPFESVELWIGITEGAALIEEGKRGGDRRGLGSAQQIEPAIFDGTQWAKDIFLDNLERTGKTEGRKAGQSHDTR